MNSWKFEYYSKVKVHQNKDVNITIIRDDKTPEATIVLRTQYQTQSGWSMEQMTLTEDEFYELCNIIKLILEEVEKLTPPIKTH